MKDNRSNEFLVQMEKLGEFCRDENNSLLWLLFTGRATMWVQLWEPSIKQVHASFYCLKLTEYIFICKHCYKFVHGIVFVFCTVYLG